MKAFRSIYTLLNMLYISIYFQTMEWLVLWGEGLVVSKWPHWHPSLSQQQKLTFYNPTKTTTTNTITTITSQGKCAAVCWCLWLKEKKTFCQEGKTLWHCWTTHAVKTDDRKRKSLNLQKQIWPKCWMWMQYLISTQLTHSSWTHSPNIHALTSSCFCNPIS